MIKEISSNKVPVAGPYSQAVKAGEFLFCSGQVGLSPSTGELVGDNVEAQTEQAIENMQEILASANLSFQDVVRVELFLTNMKEFEKVNEVYKKYFQNSARQTVGVQSLPKDAKVEVSCIAYAGK